MPERKLARKRERPMIKLTELMFSDPDVKQIIARTVSAHKVGSLHQLAVTKPKVFDELHEVVLEFIEEAPFESRPRFLS
jgi:hypothetical protein